MAGPNKGTEMAFIDCCMLVLTTEDESKSIGITSGVKLGVEPQIETTDPVKLIIKGTLKAQKKGKSTVTGHKLTITDNLTILEMLELLQGGTLSRDPETHKITGYKPPVVGEAYTPVKCKLDAYAAQMDEGGNVLQYEKTTYPGCTGQPVGLSSEDDVFRINEYTIDSAPGKGEAPYEISYVDELPVLTDANPKPALGSLTVSSSAGSEIGKTHLTVTPAKEGGNLYKTSTTHPSPAYDEDVGAWDSWDGSADVTASTGSTLRVVECTAENRARKAGSCTVTARDE